MARHAENCSGEVEDAENGAPTPKKGKRGKKRKMRSRRDEEDSGECLMFYGSVGMISVQVCDLMSFMYLCHSEEDHAEPDEEEEGEEEASLLQEEEEAESMELDQAPAAIPVPAPDEPPVKRKRGRPPKNAPKPLTPSKSVRVAAKTTASGENTDL